MRFVRHGAELDYLFPDVSQLRDPQDRLLADRILLAWWEFADGKQPVVEPPQMENSTTNPVRRAGVGERGLLDGTRGVFHGEDATRRSPPSSAPKILGAATSSTAWSTLRPSQETPWPAYEQGRPFSFALGVGADWGRNAALDRLERCADVWNRDWRVWQGACIGDPGGERRQAQRVSSSREGRTGEDIVLSSSPLSGGRHTLGAALNAARGGGAEEADGRRQDGAPREELELPEAAGGHELIFV